MRVLRCAAESIDGVGAGYWRARAWSSSVGAGGSDPMRFPSLEPERMSPAQKRVHDAIASGPRGGVRGPFGVLLRSPELADRVQKVGEHLRFNSSLPARLNELAILINARFWGSKYEWYAHRPLAIRASVSRFGGCWARSRRASVTRLIRALAASDSCVIPRRARSSATRAATRSVADGITRRAARQPRPTNGILVAITVMNSTLASGGSEAMYTIARAVCSTSMSGSGMIVPLACGTPFFIRAASGVSALPMSSWPTAMSYLRPSSDAALVSPVTAWLVEV